MAESFVVSASRVERWQNKYFKEYVRAWQLSDLMGESSNRPICVKMDLSKQAGEVIHIPLIGKLTGPGVTGNAELSGNETALSNYDAALTVDWRRKGVLITKKEEGVTEMDLRMAAKDQLKVWAMEQLRDDVLEECLSPVIGGTVRWRDSNTTQQNAWTAANTDRVFYVGTTTTMSSGTDVDVALNTIEAANIVTIALLREFKRLIKTASPRIRPINIDKRGEFFVGLMPSLPFAALKTAMDSVHQNAAPRSVRDNPIFTDGDIVLDNVIWKEIPELDDIIDVTTGANPLPTSGASSAPIAPVFLLGAQAIGAAWGQKGRLVVDPDRDYKFRWGVAHEECLEVEKLFYNNVQHGMGTLFLSNAAS